ncbi:MAG: hypothetical protein IJ705_06370 [Oscillospiraceae bacterium]|nr:hypothetical protein [Oscillospiraceae bacterium]
MLNESLPGAPDLYALTEFMKNAPQKKGGMGFTVKAESSFFERENQASFRGRLPARELAQIDKGDRKCELSVMSSKKTKRCLS